MMLIVFALLIGIPFFFVLGARGVAADRIRDGRDPVGVLYRFNRFVRYFHTLYLFPFLACIYGVAWYETRHLDSYQLRLSLLLASEVLAYTILRTEYAFIRHPVYRKLADLPVMRAKYVAKCSVQSLGKGLIFGVLYFGVMFMGPLWVASHETFTNIYIMLYVLLLGVLAPWVYPILIRARKMKTADIPGGWIDRVNDSGLRSVQFYLWNTGDLRIANAMAIGLMRRNVVVSDYLLNTLSPEESEAVIAHELGHLRNHHSFWLLIFVEAWVPLVVLLHHLVHNPLLNLLTVLGFLVAYQGLFYHWLSRQFEYQADRHSVHVMGTSSHTVRALEKISNHHRTPRSVPGFDELWMTHPSLEHRIGRIQRVNVQNDSELQVEPV